MRSKSTLCERLTTQLFDFCDPFLSANDVNKDVYSSRGFWWHFPLDSLSPFSFYPLFLREFCCSTCGWHLYTSVRTRYSNREIERAVRPFCPFQRACMNHDRDSSSFRSNRKRRITFRTSFENPTTYVTWSKAIAIGKEWRWGETFYLIYGVDCEIVASIDLGSVLYHRMIANRAVVAQDEAQQAYL